MQGVAPQDLDSAVAQLERTLQASIALMKRRRHEMQRARRQSPAGLLGVLEIFVGNAGGRA